MHQLRVGQRGATRSRALAFHSQVLSVYRPRGGRGRGALSWRSATWLAAPIPAEMKGEGQEAISPPTPSTAGWRRLGGRGPEPGCWTTALLSDCVDLGKSLPPSPRFPTWER